MVRSLIYDHFFEEEAAAGGLGDVGVVVGRVEEEEGAEGEEAEEEDTLQGRDVYWWTLFTNEFLFSPKASLLEHVRRTRLALGWSEDARVGKQFSKVLDKVALLSEYLVILSKYTKGMPFSEMFFWWQWEFIYDTAN
jgi:hypothetical protein